MSPQQMLETFVAVLAIALGAGASIYKFVDLDRGLTLLKQEIADLRAENAQLKKENGDLRAENRHLREQFTEALAKLGVTINDDAESRAQAGLL